MDRRAAFTRPDCRKGPLWPSLWRVGSGKALSGVLLALGMVALVLLTARAAGEGDPEWSTDSLLDFSSGTMDGVDVWSDPGTVRLDRAWYANARVNDASSQDKFDPRLSFVLTNTGGTTTTIFLIVWADERHSDQYPDIFFSQSTDGGQSWSADVQIADDCYPSSPPYPNCPSLHTPDIAVRLTDQSFWVVWHQDQRETGTDRGDIYYAVSHDKGASWSSPASVYTGTGRQLRPRIVSHGQSGYLYTIWEDERDDAGDLYISRYNPDVDTAWSSPVKINDDGTGNEQREPALVVDGEGNAYAVWEDTRNDPDGQIYFSRWMSGTTWGTWSTNTRLSDPLMDWGHDPDIVAGPGGVLFAAWVERVPTGPASSTYDFQVVVARSDDDGGTWTSSVVHRLDKASASNAFYAAPAIGIGPAGVVYVAWLHSPDSQASTSNILFSQSPDGGIHWTRPRVLSSPGGTVDVDTSPTLLSNLLASPVAVAWQDFRDGASTQIYATGYPADHYLTSGEYNRTLDAGGPAAWGNITWTATITPGTDLVLATRVMTAVGAGWTAWYTHAASGEAIPHPSGRFIQYRARFTSGGNDTPVLDKVVISYEQYRTYLPFVLRES